MKQRTRRNIILIWLVVMLAIVGETLAFYSNQGGSIENVMATNGSSVYMQELFDPANLWLPGETKQKELKFGNKGEQDQVIRFRIETQWFSASGGTWEPMIEKPAWVKWATTLNQEWTKFIDDDDWYYYNKILPANTETAKVMEAVTFSAGLSNDSYAENFSNATYRIVVYMEALDVNPTITEAKWKKTFVGNEEITWED